MPFKLNISEKGKAWKLEISEESLSGKSVGDIVKGEEIKPELAGYEMEITGGSDNAGFPLHKEVEGIALQGVLLTKGFAMRDNTEGIRRRKTVRGKTISPAVSQINLKVVKEGSKPLAEIFPEQNKPKEKKAETQTPAAAPAG
jgi:small subunit ribosomal protein S6e